jgi:hypothetical protein
MNRTTADIRLNYGAHALLLSKRDFGMYGIRVWVHCQNGNTHLNPDFQDIDLGIHADYVYAKAVGEHYLSDNGLWDGDK